MADKQAVLAICMLLVAVCCTTIDLEGDCIPAEGYESCACYMKGVNNTREYINLLPLKGNSSNPRFTAVGKKGWYYLYNPCAEFNEFVNETGTGHRSCVNVSVARMTNLSAHQCDSLGDKASATFTYKSTNNTLIKSKLTLHFMSRGAEHYSAVISLVCSDSVAKNESILEYLGTINDPVDTYYLSLTSKCCCPGKCGIPPVPLVPVNSTTKVPIIPTAAKQSSGKGLKTWEIIAIAAGSALLLLLIVGLLCCCRKRAGYQTI